MTRTSRPHVLMTADAVGGVWTYAVDLSAGLVEAGWRVTLAVLGPRPSEAQSAAAVGAGAALVETGLSLDWLAEAPSEVARSAEAIVRLAGSCGADLVHLNSPSLAGAAPFVLPVVGVCHSCVATWWDAVRGGPAPEAFRWRTEALRLGYGACDALIAPSFAFAQHTLILYGVAAKGVRNGRRPEGRRFDLTEKTPHVFTSGRLWDEGKNIAALDAAASLMSGDIVAAGALTGPQGETVSLRSVLSIGALSPMRMTQQVNQAAIYASLARYEPFGLGVLEAAQAGCALVLSDIPAFRELWTGAAVFTSADDPVGTAHILDSLLQDPAECRRLGRQALTRAAAYTVERMTEGTLDVYRTVLRVAEDEAAA